MNYDSGIAFVISLAIIIGVWYLTYERNTLKRNALRDIEDAIEKERNDAFNNLRNYESDKSHILEIEKLQQSSDDKFPLLFERFNGNADRRIEDRRKNSRRPSDQHQQAQT
jgi:hypothetical protein